MNLSDVAKIRLQTQQIAATKFKTAENIVGWLGAMQAQDYAMAKWAIGVRLPDSIEKEIEKAIDDGKIIRTHVLRPTWHFVVPEDVRWMLELSAPQIKTRMKSRDKELGITEKVYSKSNSIIEKALADGKHLTANELMDKLEKNKIDTSNYRSGHFLLRAQLDGITCNGITREKKLTHALLDERIPKSKKINKDEALGKLAQTYFSSHCPATLKDFIWWSGLSVNDARHALEMIKSNFIAEKIGEETYWLTHSFSIPKIQKPSVFLLPSFDEFLISYKDRSASIILEHQKKAFSSNGIFWPVIIVNGQATGMWKRKIKNDKVMIEIEFFIAPDKTTKKLILEKANAFGHFLNKKTEIVYK
jgi:hypothetical protein